MKTKNKYPAKKKFTKNSNKVIRPDFITVKSTITSENINRKNTLLFRDIKSYIEEARSRVEKKVNTELVLLNWNIGRRIQQEILKNTRADYGLQICATLSHKLTEYFGNGYTRSSLTRMIIFYKVYP